ncbi:MAG: S-adenosylmethionine decarboxylase [Candidatus Nanoarchaeia archaeon]|nr:S-adenosylmethionine decarboxylase [Candidatus Nanoarchaeia archaeon]
MYNYSSWINETDPIILKTKFENQLIKSGFGIISTQENFFTPFGYTAIFLLSESHFAIHTFPEENQTYIELSSCVKSQFDKFIKEI